jgi:uncharacterized protein (TIGR02594 family)
MTESLKIENKVDGFVTTLTEPTKFKKRALIFEASRWVGVTEKGGENRGQVVEMFQKAYDNLAQGEPWCMAFVQFCLKNTEAMYLATFGKQDAPSKLFATEHCLTCWAKTPPECRLSQPEVGAVVIWRHGQTASGHTGIVTAVDGNGGFSTIEGNTGAGVGVVREGDGVFRRERTMAGAGDMRVVGFLKPWGK